MTLVQQGSRGIHRSHDAIRSFFAIGSCFKYRVKVLQLPPADLWGVRFGRRRTFCLIGGAYLREETEYPCVRMALILPLHLRQGSERVDIGNVDVTPSN